MADPQEPVKPQTARRVGKRDIIPGTIEQNHMAAKTAVVKFGKITERPKIGNNYCLAFFATDQNKLYIWNNQQWKSTTLS